MGESYELEEGEMNCSVDDLDVDLSYIDQKVQNVLGHLQKDVVAGSLNLFGPKIYDYGSFLPTYKRLPAVPIPSCQMSSLGNHAIQGFSNGLPGKNVVQKFQSLPTISCKLVSNQDPPKNQNPVSLLAQAPDKVPVKKGNEKTPGNDLYGHKPITVRIKMGSATLSRKVTIVSNDLGIDPNSAPRNGHDGNSRIVPDKSLEKTCESPYRIIQEMTAFHVPDDLLLSPLPGSLLRVKYKEKRYTLSGNETVLKAGNEPPIQMHNKLSDVSGCEETPSGRRRKAVDCFDATTRNVRLSICEIKKQKVSSTGDVARENLTWGLGEACSSNDGLRTKNNLQKGIRKDGERDPIVTFAKSNKMTIARKQTEKDTKKMSSRLKQDSSKNHFGDNFLRKMPFSDASMDTAVDFAVVPSSNSLDLDNWAQCDSCEEWRLLPSGLKPEQLPKKWLCSMQTWLPGMNHCGISMEETMNAIRFRHGTEARGPESSDALPNLTEKNSFMKDLSRGVSNNVLVDAAKPVMRSKSHVFKIKNMKLPVETPNGTRIFRDFGTVSQIKIKRKKESDDQESERSQQIETGDGNKLSRENLDWTPAERKTKRHDNDFNTSDVERDTKKRLLATKKKPDNQTQLTTDSGSLCTKADGIIDSSGMSLQNQNLKSGDLPCTTMKTVFRDRPEIKNTSAVTHETMDRSYQAANDSLQKAEKLMELADCLKRSGFDHKYKKANFKAALKFLRGASLLEMCSTEKVEGGKMSHVEAFRTAAKLSESCAQQYEANQEMATAALSYKCMEVACMRVVYGRSPGLSGELNELQKIVQMTPEGESPSSSASDVDIFNHQGVVDKSAKTKRVLIHVAGNHHHAPRNQQNLLPLLDFTENMNLAMEASAKSQSALKAATVTLEETHRGDCVSALKNVVDFSFHDVEALIELIKLAMGVLSSSSFCAPKC
ncbi:unnamed protein product [Cochlearia groenlandica]